MSCGYERTHSITAAPQSVYVDNSCVMQQTGLSQYFLYLAGFLSLKHKAVLSFQNWNLKEEAFDRRQKSRS